jgi:hypothetical protein
LGPKNCLIWPKLWVKDDEKPKKDNGWNDSLLMKKPDAEETKTDSSKSL